MQWQVLEQLPDDEQRAVLRIATRRRYRRGDSLFHEGDPGDSFHLVASGHVAIRSTGRMGDVITLAVLGPGDCFGEQALLAPDARRTASAVAIDAVETMMLRRDDFEDLRRRRPVVSDVLVGILAAQVRRLSRHLLEAHALPAEARVVNRLADLAGLFPADSHGDVSIPITQVDLASLAGTTRSTANRALQSLVDDGLIALHRGRIEVLAGVELEITEP